MWAFRGVEDGSALAMTSGGSRLSPDAVVTGAIEILADYPYLAAALPERRIRTSVEATWPDPPHPLIFWLYVAASSGLVGSGAARACVSSLEAIVALLKTTTFVSGAWQSRFSRLLPKPRAATYDDGTEFRSALFELIGAFRLVTTGTAVQLQGGGPTPSCDLLIGSAGTPFVGVEVYCPQKGAEAWYRDSVQQPWQSLISGDPLRIEDVEPAPGRVVDISMAPDAVGQALSRVLTDSNFQDQKARQLAAGDLPTLLMIRAYGLTRRFEELITAESSLALAGEIGAEAWARLPDQCNGILVAFLGDVLQDVVRRASPVAFVPSPRATISDAVWACLSDAGTLSKDLLETRPSRS
jgi:hypothetical protein